MQGLYRTRATLYSVQAQTPQMWLTVFSSTYEREAVKELRTRRDTQPATIWRIEKTKTPRVMRT